MKMMKTINIMSAGLFKREMQRLNIHDSNVEIANIAIISIGDVSISKTPNDFTENGINCHWFKEEHPNVLNIDFDDCSPECGKGNPLSEKQAQQIYKFFCKNIAVDNFYIHCSAGISRSAAVGLCLRDFFNSLNYKVELKHNGIMPNSYVERLIHKIIRDEA